MRYDPLLRAAGKPPFLLDSRRPSIPLADYRYRELRFRALANAHPDEAERLMALAQDSIERRWNNYEQMAASGPNEFPLDGRKDR